MELPKGFDLDLALELAGLSNDAYVQYDDYKSGKKWPGPEGYCLEAEFNAVYENKNLPIGFIASKGNDVYVSWRGTSSPEEWIEDAKFDQTDCSFLPGSVKVELGFHELYVTGKNGSSPQDVVLNFLKRKQVAGKLYVTGHSLGGALAVLNILDIAKNTVNKCPVLYSFAGPRAGSPDYASVYDGTISDSWRVVNSNDEVPKLPMKDTFGNHYEHVNTEFDITFGGKFIWEWGDDHSLTNYIKQLKKLSEL